MTQEEPMRISLTILALLFLSVEAFSVPTTLTLPEKEYYQYVQGVRTRKFSDREIDRIHLSLAKMLEEIKGHVESKTVQNAALYNAHIPVPEETLFFKDKEGKEYYSIFLGQGVTLEEFPNTQIYNKRVYIYPSEDKKSLSKVIVQFIKVNTTGTVYVKEMRRIVNTNPVAPGPPKVEGEKINGDLPKDQEPITTDPEIAPQENGELTVEYYSGHDSVHPWVQETPDAEAKLSLSQKLQDEKALMPFPSQKKIYLSYRDILRELDSKIKNKLHNIDLDRKMTVKKIINFE